MTTIMKFILLTKERRSSGSREGENSIQGFGKKTCKMKRNFFFFFSFFSRHANGQQFIVSELLKGHLGLQCLVFIPWE